MVRTSQRTKSRAGKGSTFLIAGLLAISAGLRVFSSAEVAWAQEEVDIQEPQTNFDTQQPEDVTSERAEASRLLRALQQREATVEERETQIEIRAKSLDVAQQEIERRIAALEEAEQRLTATLAIADSAAENDLARLTAVYENMKPKEAAELFQAMEPQFAAGFLGRMQTEAAANIMAGLEPEAAYSISAILAGRNANAPKN